MTTYRPILFLQGEEATNTLDFLDEHGEEATIEYLCDLAACLEPGEPGPAPCGASDSCYFDGYFLLSWNFRLGYIGLASQVPEPGRV